MKKKNAVQTISIPSAHSNNTLIHQTSNVSAKITLSDSILSGAVIEYRKAGYNFIRHLHTNLSNSFRRMLYGYSVRNTPLHRRGLCHDPS
mgnify:CR=1 FL=1